MKRLLFLVALFGGLLLSAPAWAVDGRQCQDTNDADIPLHSRGGWIPVTCVQLCDGKAAADSTCSEYDFANAPGMPDLIVFEYEDVGGGCSGTPDFTITTGPVTGGSPAYDLDSSAVVLNSTTDRVVIRTEAAPVDRYLFTSIADDTGCLGVDIRMFLYNRKTGGMF